MKRHYAIIAAAMSVSMLAPAAAVALDKATKCQAAKHRAIGRYWLCQETALALALTKQKPVDLTRCNEAFGRSWQKIEAKSAGQCPTRGDATAIGGRINSCATTLTDALQPMASTTTTTLAVTTTTTATTRTTTTLAGCGNGVVDPGETCDPPSSCPVCGAESYLCYTSTGSAATCDLRCHVPVTTCDSGDHCCAFDGSGGCGSETDGECTGSAWAYLRWGQDAAFTPGCTTLRVYGIQPGGSYAFTTCVPPGTTGGTGDSVITSVVDNTGHAYDVGNDDCTDATALPLLAGWSCQNAAGQARMSCASPSPGGFVASANVYRLDVNVCPAGGAGGSGTAPFFVWWNAPVTPNPG